jgi:hypothetical protein
MEKTNSKETRIVDAVAQVRLALAALSNSEVNEVLTLVSAPYGKRPVSVYTRSSEALGTVQIVSKGNRLKGPSGKPNQVSWKKQPRFVAWSSERDEIVGRVKASNGSSAILEELHNHEAKLKVLKSELLGFRVL